MAPAGFDPLTVAFEGDDHKAYYPGSHPGAGPLHRRPEQRPATRVQLFGHRDAEVAKHVDIAAAAIFSGLSVDQVSDSTSPTAHRSAAPG